MSSKILLKKSTTASATPTTLDLDVGEVAINTEDKRLFTKDSGGSIVEVSTTPSTMDVDGNATVGGTLDVTGTTTLGTATVSTKLTVPTPTDSTDAASKGYVDTAVTNVIDAAPGALDTLNELAAAIGDDANFSTTITNSLATKAPLASPALTGTPTAPTASADTNTTQIATTAYVQTEVADYLPLAGGTMTGDITLGANAATSTADPTTDDELARKGYVDSILGSATDAATSATNAATSASEAATSASNASTSETNAATSAASAAASYDNFDDRYLGAKATAPALDNDGDALVTGALYFDTTVGSMYVYDGASWGTVAPVATSVTVSQITDLTATATELNYVDGVTSNIQTQIDNIDTDPTKGTLTKTFTNGETASITLSSAITPAPVVSVTKEVSQVGVSSKGAWDVNSTGSNYTLHDTAYATTLTPGSIGIAVQNSTYASKSVDVSGTDSRPHAVFFKPDGTKMYTVGDLGDKVFEYDLSTAYDVSTATYSSNSFTVSGQEGNTYALCFSTDGTKMYTGGLSSTIFEYTLSTAWDVSTASYSSNSLYVAGQSTNVRGLFIKSDGTKLFTCQIGNDTVFEYDLSTAYDLSTGTYSSNSISVASQDTTPNALAFTSDGLSFCIAGENSDTVYQYDMTTAWDVSTASYSSNSFSISSQETTVTGLHIIEDENKMYIVGEPGTVYQYTLGSKDGLVLGSGSFASTDVGKRIEGNGGEAILTAADGSYSVVTAFDDSSTIASGSWSMYALDVDATNGITLSGLVTGFADASTWSYDNKLFNTGVNNRGIAFKPDGTKMYVAAYSENQIREYNLSTPFDVSTASYASVSLDHSGQGTQNSDVLLNNDGTKLYVLTVLSTRSIFQYSLSTAYDLSTASYDNVSFSVSSQETSPTGMIFGNSGTKLYVNGFDADSIFQYSLSTAYDISTASYDSVSFSILSLDGASQGIDISTDGTKMYIVGNANDSIREFQLSTAFDLSTISYVQEFNIGTESSVPVGVRFANNGTKMYVGDGSTGEIYQYTTASFSQPTSQYHPAVTSASGQIDTAFWTDINTMTADETLNGGEVYYAVSTDDRTTWAVIDNTDGVRNIVRNNAGTWEYNDASTYSGTTWTSATTNEELYALQEALEDGNAEVTVGFDVSNASYDSVSLDVLGQSSNARSVIFNDDGTKLFLASGTNDVIYEYNLSTAYDMSTATSSGNTLTVTQNNPDFTYSLLFNSDGTTLYVAFRTTANASIFNAYNLSTAYDLSTASYDSLALTVTTEVGSNPVGTVFNNDGTKLYILSSSNIDVYQYSLSTAYDVSTATYDSVSLDVSDSGNDSPLGLSFNSDGTKLFLVDNASDEIVQYSLSTAYDLSTASSVSVLFDVSNQAILPTDVVFNANGTKMYVLDITADKVFQYSTGSTSNYNRMNSTQLEAVTDPNHYTLGDTLDLMIALYLGTASASGPSSDGVSINYDAAALNQGAVVGTDYDYDFPDSTTVRITSNAAQNLKIRVV